MAAANASFSPLAQFLANPSEWTSNTPLQAIFGAVAVILLSTLLLRSSSNEKVYELGGIPIVTAWTFFTRRYDFIQDRFKESKGKMFRFRVLQHRVLSMAGETSRKVFFNEPGLSMTEGYRILMGGAPELKDIKVQTTSDGEDVQSDVDEGFIKRLLSLVRKDRIADTLPALLDDLDVRVSGWGAEGKINPFKDVYDLVFQMTIRMATCQELAEDREAMDLISKTYWTLEQSATPVSLLLPWFPGPAKKAKEKATTALYTMFLKFVERRRNAATPSTDPIDILIAQGHSDQTIIGTIMGIVFAGVINTGMNACWTLLYLGSNPTWKKRVTDEYKTLVEKHTDTLSTEPLHKRLATIPLNAWEDELPTLDLVIRETLRLTLTGSAIRRNLHQNVKVEDDIVVKTGEFMTYQLADVHLNPSIYPEPLKFDPERYLEGREEDRKETFAYLGWGVGRHPCAGMKIAKLEVKLALALILLGFEYELVDGSGKYPKALPVPDRNDIQQARPLGEPCYLKVKRVME
ncbi:hypothetical protein GALMADRAFT_136397 [Galerina marginata CBS 339.88]|uniref:Cytochrome P450 n=1 Tax=Galerina marginata (strain CBS 339.88) TaxID=685588 RepID=A0A067T9A1_GALM3|nr:hypothetical protein GALMADRAFT_136397 [Galerina marginata CBS 339.88]